MILLEGEFRLFSIVLTNRYIFFVPRPRRSCLAADSRDTVSISANLAWWALHRESLLYNPFQSVLRGWRFWCSWAGSYSLVPVRNDSLCWISGRLMTRLACFSVAINYVTWVERGDFPTWIYHVFRLQLWTSCYCTRLVVDASSWNCYYDFEKRRCDHWYARTSTSADWHSYTPGNTLPNR